MKLYLILIAIAIVNSKLTISDAPEEILREFTEKNN